MSGEKTKFFDQPGVFFATVVILFAIAFGGAYLLWSTWGPLPYAWSEGEENRMAWAGTFGDSYGYVNSLFSGLAFGGVIVAILLQTIELRYQRAELRATQEELRRSANAQESTQKTMALTAYLNAATAVLDGHATRRESERRPELRPSTMKHDILLGSLEWTLAQLRLDCGDHLVVPSRDQLVRFRVRSMAELLRGATAEPLAEKRVGDIEILAKETCRELANLRDLLSQEKQKELDLRQNLQSIIDRMKATDETGQGTDRVQFWSSYVDDVCAEMANL